MALQAIDSCIVSQIFYAGLAEKLRLLLSPIQTFDLLWRRFWCYWSWFALWLSVDVIRSRFFKLISLVLAIYITVQSD